MQQAAIEATTIIGGLALIALEILGLVVFVTWASEGSNRRKAVFGAAVLAGSWLLAFVLALLRPVAP